jgi:hypothetical protein
VGADKITGRRRTICDIAYCCFVFTGFFSLLAWVGDKTDDSVYLLIILIGLWLILPSGIAAVVGIVLSLIVWRHWPLLVLSLLTLLLLKEILTDAGSAKFFAEAQIAYAITCFAFTLAWFTRFRKRYETKVENADSPRVRE